MVQPVRGPLPPGDTGSDRPESAPPHGEMELDQPERAPPHGEVELDQPERAPPHGEMELYHSERAPPHGEVESDQPECAPPHGERELEWSEGIQPGHRAPSGVAPCADEREGSTLRLPNRNANARGRTRRAMARSDGEPRSSLCLAPLALSTGALAVLFSPVRHTKAVQRRCRR